MDSRSIEIIRHLINGGIIAIPGQGWFALPAIVLPAGVRPAHQGMGGYFWRSFPLVTSMWREWDDPEEWTSVLWIS